MPSHKLLIIRAKNEEADSVNTPGLPGNAMVIQEEVLARQTFQTIQVQATPMTIERAVQTGDQPNIITRASRMPDLSLAYEMVEFRSPMHPQSH